MTEPLDLYDVACLAGGLDRVVDTALVALVESGRVRVQAPGELVTVALVRRHPVEAAVLDAIGPAGHRSAETVRWRLTTDERLLGLARRLRDAGLLAAGGGVPVARRSRWRLAPTYSGRSVLHRLRDAPPADDLTGSPSAMTVALHGRERMRDQALRAAIFEQQTPASAVAPGLRGRPPAGLDHADGWEAGRRTRAEILKDATFFGPGG